MAEYDLRSTLAAVRDKPQNFVLFRGEDADQILITPNPATTRQIAGVEAECGKLQRVMGGLCFREGDRLVFSTRLNPAPAWEMLISGVLKARRCAPAAPIELRQLDLAEPEEIISQPIPGNAGTATEDQPPDVKERWEQLKASVLPDLKAALASPASKDSVAKTVAAASAAEKAGDYATAIALMEPLASSLFLDALAAEHADNPQDPPAV